MASCEAEDLVVANKALAVRSLKLSIAMEDLVKNLQKKNDEMREKLEASASCEDEVRKTKASVKEAKMK